MIFQDVNGLYESISNVPFLKTKKFGVMDNFYTHYGDVNDDELVDILDVIITQEFIYDNLSQDSYLLSNANLNFDDTINIIDVVLIIEKILTN